MAAHRAPNMGKGLGHRATPEAEEERWYPTPDLAAIYVDDPSETKGGGPLHARHPVIRTFRTL